MTPNENDVKIKNQSDEAVEADSCGAGALKHLVGQSYNTVKDLPKHRWMRPGYKYTQQYKPSRLNIVTDENGIIKSVRCG